MKMEINIPDYTAEQGLSLEWDYGFSITVHLSNGGVIIQANEAGLISLARQLLSLAQSSIPAGYHLHYDDQSSLEDGSSELIIEKAYTPSG